MLKAKSIQAIKTHIIKNWDSMGQMRIVCNIMLTILFLETMWLPIIKERFILVCILLFEWYLFLCCKELLIDKRFFVLLIATCLHVVIYNCLIERMKPGEAMDLALLPPLFYLLGKQLLYYPREGRSFASKIGLAIGVILAGHFVVSWLEMYAYYVYPKYPSRMWDDFWRGEQFYATQYSFFAAAWMSLLFFSFWIIKKRTSLSISLLVGIFVINALNVLNGNRMHLGILIVTFIFSFAVFFFQNRDKRKLLLKIVIGAVILLTILAIIIIFNIGGIKDAPYINRLLRLATDARFGIYKNVLYQMPLYPWGGEQIDLGEFAHAHNMWLQMYNESGIITYLFLCIFTILNIVDCINIVIKSEIEEGIKYVIPPICLGLFLYLSFESGGKDYIILYTFFAGMAAQISQKIKKIKGE